MKARPPYILLLCGVIVATGMLHARGQDEVAYPLAAAGILFWAWGFWRTFIRKKPDR